MAKEVNNIKVDYTIEDDQMDEKQANKLYRKMVRRKKLRAFGRGFKEGTTEPFIIGYSVVSGVIYGLYTESAKLGAAYGAAVLALTGIGNGILEVVYDDDLQEAGV